MYLFQIFLLQKHNSGKVKRESGKRFSRFSTRRASFQIRKLYETLEKYKLFDETEFFSQRFDWCNEASR